MNDASLLVGLLTDCSVNNQAARGRECKATEQHNSDGEERRGPNCYGAGLRSRSFLAADRPGIFSSGYLSSQLYFAHHSFAAPADHRKRIGDQPSLGGLLIFSDFCGLCHRTAQLRVSFLACDAPPRDPDRRRGHRLRAACDRRGGELVGDSSRPFESWLCRRPLHAVGHRHDHVLSRPGSLG